MGLLRKTTRYLFIAVLLAGCAKATPLVSTGFSPPTVREAELLGTWKVTSDVYPITEEVTLFANGQYHHLYDSPTLPYHYEGRGKWWLKRQPNGCVSVYLDGMRYYQSETYTAEHGNRTSTGVTLHFEDPCDQAISEMLGYVRLAVMDAPNSPHGLMLIFPRDDVETSHVLMEWKAAAVKPASPVAP